MSTAIAIENLGKKYVISHQVKSVYRYTALRDVMMESSRKLWRRTLRQPVADPTREEFWALKDVSLEVEEGDRLGIIGRNGAGKSTLLKVLSRITEPTTGRVRIKGRVASLLEVGTGFHPELTGRENIYLNGAILGMTRAEIKRKFDEIVEFSEIEKFLDTPVKRYSSGMYVRLAFAVAAHLDPEILLVDEVLAVGDAQFQKKCLGKMGEVSKEGRTVLFVSHNMAAVTQLCRRAIWLDGGAVRHASDARDTVERYISTGSAEIAERNWAWPGEAPGDDRVRLLGCSVRQNGQASAIIDINREMSIQLDFAVLTDARNLVTGVSFYNAENFCIFASCDWRPNSLNVGAYTKSVAIPTRVLAEGAVSVLVQIISYEPDIKSLVLPGALAFTAIDSDDPLTVRGPYKGTWPGVVRLGLDWGEAVKNSVGASA